MGQTVMNVLNKYQLNLNILVCHLCDGWDMGPENGTPRKLFEEHKF